jgi:hypothetical protein
VRGAATVGLWAKKEQGPPLLLRNSLQPLISVQLGATDGAARRAFWPVPPRTWTGAWDVSNAAETDNLNQVVGYCHGHSAPQKTSHFLRIESCPLLMAPLPTRSFEPSCRLRRRGCAAGKATACLTPPPGARIGRSAAQRNLRPAALVFSLPIRFHSARPQSTADIINPCASPDFFCRFCARRPKRRRSCRIV